jgi:hypothetical protein
MELPIADISHTIQLSLAPAFLLVAIGNLIIILTNRLGRIIDRRRVLLNQPPEIKNDPEVIHEIADLHHRRIFIYFAILFAVIGALLVCLVIAGAFIGALLNARLAEIVAGLFVLTMLFLVIAWTLFLREIYLSIRIGPHPSKPLSIKS